MSIVSANLVHSIEADPAHNHLVREAFWRSLILPIAEASGTFASCERNLSKACISAVVVIFAVFALVGLVVEDFPGWT